MENQTQKCKTNASFFNWFKQKMGNMKNENQKRIEVRESCQLATNLIHDKFNNLNLEQKLNLVYLYKRRQKINKDVDTSERFLEIMAKIETEALKEAIKQLGIHDYKFKKWHVCFYEGLYNNIDNIIK
jgi:hypothetical protein